MDKWFRLLAEERASAAGIKRSIKTLTQQGGNEGGNPTGMKKVEDPLKDKDDKDKISAPPGAPGGGSVGAPGGALEEDARDERPQPEPSQVNATKAQRQYKALRRKNDIYSQPAGHKNLSSGAPFDNKTKPAGTDRLRFEDVEPESFEKNPTLEPHFWQDDKLDSKISRRLKRIAQDFLDGLDMPIDMIDLRFTGSLANYNWSRYSDVDLHIVADFSKIDEDTELVKSFFDASRMRWNDLHRIVIYGYEVEIYVENVGDEHRSSGVYSITEDEWITAPNSEDVHFDFSVARRKSDDVITQINMIEKFAKKNPRATLSSVERLKSKIRAMRKAGLMSAQQEFSAENIAFKILRREEALQKLSDLKYDAYDDIMSMELR
jgi:hypothetical protein